MELLRRSTIILVWLFYFSQKSIIDVLIRNKFALQQMQPSNTGYVKYQLVRRLSNYLWLIPLLLTIILLLPDFKKLTKKH